MLQRHFSGKLCIHTMIFARLRISARDVLLLMLHVGFSMLFRLRVSLNVDWAVLPPVSNVAAIPEEATAIAI